MSPWNFIGRVPASKSILLRALIAQSFYPQLEIRGDSASDDVIKMRQALANMRSGQVMDCGHSAAVLRFLAIRAAREPGKHRFIGSERLFERPQNELVRTLQQLGCQAEIKNGSLEIQSWGWKMSGDALHIKTQESSQFVSGVILSAWELPQALYLQLGRNGVSRGYLEMTCRFMEHLGLKIEPWAEGLAIPAKQSAKVEVLVVEPDMSCAFAVAALAAVGGTASLVGFSEESVQPDSVFLEILHGMGVQVRFDGEHLRVDRGLSLKPVQRNLTDSPDLFPCLAVLCALAQGESELRGAEHLHLKESDRIANTAHLLRSIGRQVEVLPDGLRIVGQAFSAADKARPEFVFDPDQDHRMAMAAGVLKRAGFSIRVSTPEVVSKSFPDFWQVARV